ncbi:MAG: hypothetical protein QNK85_10660 [Crocinitomicaceae bacterium]
MREIIYTSLMIVLPLLAFAQQGVIWEPEVTVADGDTFGYIRPRLSLVNDLPIIMLGKGGDGEIFIAKGNGTSFNVPISVLPNGMQTYMASWTGPDIASKGNNVVVVFKAQPIGTGNIYAVRSINGGDTFSDTIRVDNFNQGETWMPALDMDDNGNPHVTYMVLDAGGGNEGIAIASSTDGGATYQAQQVVTDTSPGVACDCCPPEIIVKGEYQLALFRNNEVNIRDTWGSLSTDNGASFNSNQNLDELGWMISSCPSTGPHGLIISDSAYVVSASKAEGKYRVYLSTTGLSEGLNLSSVQIMNEPTSSIGDSQNFPRISGSGDTLIVVWEERELGNTNILCAVTTDGNAQTLGSFKSKVNSGQTGFQGKPDVIFKNGFIHVVYQDLADGNVIYRKGTISDVTDINEINGTVVSIYPNPTSQLVTINGIKKKLVSSIIAIEATGTEVEIDFDWMSSETILIDFGNKVNSGNYFIQFGFTNGSSFSKMVSVE